MPASSRLPLAVIALLLLSLSCPTATAMGNDHYSDGGGGGRVVGTIHGRGTGAAGATGAVPSSSSSSSKWQRRLEEAVAPEFGSVLAAGQAGYISYDTLNKDRQSCGGRCAAQGASYTRPCYYSDGCRG